jgi:hypothetical protein
MTLAKPQRVAMRPGAREAHERLTRALINLAAAGLRTDCSDVALHHLWLSESQQERAVAVRLCRGCPVLRECAEVGRYERFGVFGGVDRTPDRTRSTQTKINNRGEGRLSPIFPKDAHPGTGWEKLCTRSWVAR